jgi:hypothetical protein
MVKRVALLLILLLALFFGVFCYLSRSSIKNALNQTPQVFDWKIPELPQGYNWVLSNATDAEMVNNRMFFDNRNAVAAGKAFLADKVFGDIITTGKIFRTSVTDKDSLYNESGWTLLNKIGQNLVENGWSQSVEYGDYFIAGIATGGVRGSAEGYVKRDDHLIRTIVYGYGYDGNWVDSDNNPVQLECPCSVEMTIFVGDPVDLRNYIHN